MAVLSRLQAREIDRLAMEEMGLPGIVLMENAARGLAEIVLDRATGREGLIEICCGPGNNGGDGFAMARHLANHGRDVRIHLAVDPERFSPQSDAGINLEIARKMGLPLTGELPSGGGALLVDALFGTGLSTPVRAPFLEWIVHLNGLAAPILAVDIPSGLDCDTGKPLGAAVRAGITGTMVAPKTGFAAGSAYTGEVVPVDIGVPPSLVARVTSA